MTALIARTVCRRLGLPEPEFCWLPEGTDDAFYDGQTVHIAPDAHPEWVLHELAHHCQYREGPIDGHGPNFSRHLAAVRKAWFDA